MAHRRLAGAVAVVVVASVLGGCSTQELSADEGAPTPVWAVTYTSSGELAVFTQGHVVIYDRTLTEERARVAYPGVPAGAYLQATDLSADGRVAAVAWSSLPFDVHGGDQGALLTTAATVVSFRVADGQLLSKATYPGGLAYGPTPGPDRGQLPLIRLSPTGDLLALRGFEDGYYAPPFHVRRVDGGEIVWGNQETYYPFLFSADGTLVYAFSEVTAGLISRDARTGELVQDIGGWVSHALAGSPDGRWLLGTGAPDTNSNGSLTQFTLWRTSDGTHTLPGDEAPDFYAVAPMAMSSDGQRWANLAAGDGERYEIHLWALVAGAPARLVLRVPTPYTSSPAFSPDGLEVAVGPLPAGPGRSKVNVYNASDGTLLRTRTITASL